MDETRWASALEFVKKYAFKIATPGGSGTGFMLTAPNSQGFCGVATANHVVSHAHQWEEPIKLIHAESGDTVILHNAERFIFANAQQDLAVIVFVNKKFDLPETDPTLLPEDEHLKPGIQIGWAGYPAIAPNDFSFFSGDISCFLEKNVAYLVDGVAINGVSGGPAYCVFPENVVNFVGVVTAYIPNRATGESLPGVCFVSAISPLYHIVKEIKSREEAEDKAKQIEAEQEAGKIAPECKSDKGMTG